MNAGYERRVRPCARWGRAAASRRASLCLLAALPICLGGCSVRTSRFEIIDFRKSGQLEQYHEVFDEAYYDIDGNGHVEIVLRRTDLSETDPGQEITQMVHLRTVWRSIPGETVASRTQINGTVCYLIRSGRTGATFEGAGSVFCKENRRKDTLKGTLELALLRPTRRLTGERPLFERAQLAGEFRAKRDRRRVVRLVNEMNRQFGPLPPYQPPTPGLP
jgi:hypothetical protein